MAAIGLGGWVAVKIFRERAGIGNRRELKKWQEAITGARSDAHRQAALLWGVNHSAFNVAPHAFWEVLVSVERNILDDPASTAYWQRRQEVEQILRQQDGEDGGAPS